MKRKIAVIINGYFKPDKLMIQVERLKAALSKYFSVKVYTTTELLAYTDNANIACLIDADAAVYLDKDIHIGKMLEASSVRLFNSIRAIALSDDKMLTHIALSKAGLPQPRTISSPLHYRGEDDEEFFNRAERIIGYPMVVKQCHGSYGSQVYLAHDRAEALSLRARLLDMPHIYQEYISEAVGRDLRVIVIGGKAVAAMERYNPDDFRSNIEQGGIGYKANPNAEIAEIAVRAAETLGLEYAGVDILMRGGQPLIAEVNSNAYFNKITEVTGADIPALYADYIAGVMGAR